MADYNIEIKRFNGYDYDTLYPIVSVSSIIGLNNSITTEIENQLPSAISTEINNQLPFAITTEINNQLPFAVSTEILTQTIPAISTAISEYDIPTSVSTAISTEIYNQVPIAVSTAINSIEISSKISSKIDLEVNNQVPTAVSTAIDNYDIPVAVSTNITTEINSQVPTAVNNLIDSAKTNSLFLSEISGTITILSSDWILDSSTSKYIYTLSLQGIKSTTNVIFFKVVDATTFITSANSIYATPGNNFITFTTCYTINVTIILDYYCYN